MFISSNKILLQLSAEAYLEPSRLLFSQNLHRRFSSEFCVRLWFVYFFVFSYVLAILIHPVFWRDPKHRHYHQVGRSSNSFTLFYFSFWSYSLPSLTVFIYDTHIFSISVDPAACFWVVFIHANLTSFT